MVAFFAADIRLTVSLLRHVLRPIAKADRHTVIGVHQVVRYREIHEFVFIGHGMRGFVRLVRHAGLRDACDRFGLGKCSTLRFVKQAAGLLPCLQ